LVLPLLGGAVFCWNCDYYRYQFFRRSGYEFFFMAALSGSLLLLGCYWIVELLRATSNPYVAALLKSVEGILPNKHRLGTLVATIPMGWLVALFVNCFTDGRDVKKKEVEEYGDELESMVTRAVYGSYVRPQLYMLTLSTGKVYIGVVASGVDPYLERTHLTLLKFGSGYRTSSQKIEIETTYAEVLQGVGKEESEVPSHIRASDLEVVVPKSEIVQMSKFDPQLRQHFPDGPEVA